MLTEINRFNQYQSDPVGFGEQVLGETYTDEVRALMESVRDYPVTVARSSNAVGKTHGAARVAVWAYLCFPGAQVYTAAAPPEDNLKRLLWSEIEGIKAAHPTLFDGHISSGLQISRSAREWIAGVTIPASGTEAQREAKFSGKHAPYLFFIFDEADAIPDEVFKGTWGCMSGGHARMLCMFNPRNESGEVYRMERDGRANIVHLSALNHPNVTSGRDVIPGAVTLETTVRRINEWCKPEAELGVNAFNLPSFLVGAVAKSQSGVEYPPLSPGWYEIENPAFSYMVLGQYPAQSVNQLISREWIAKARERWDAHVVKHGKKALVPGVAGHDVAEEGQDRNSLCFRHGGWVPPLIIWGGVDVLVSSDRVIDEIRDQDITAVNVDATGTGAGCAPYLKRQGITARAVKVASSPTSETEMGEFGILRDQLWWACREWLRTDPDATLPPDEKLLEELTVPTYEVKNGKIKIMDKPTMKDVLKRSPDRADSLCLTFYTETARGFDKYSKAFK